MTYGGKGEGGKCRRERGGTAGRIDDNAGSSARCGGKGGDCGSRGGAGKRTRKAFEKNIRGASWEAKNQRSNLIPQTRNGGEGGGGGGGVKGGCVVNWRGRWGGESHGGYSKGGRGQIKKKKTNLLLYRDETSVRNQRRGGIVRK